MITEQWEYFIKESKKLPVDSIHEILNGLGLDGWELCGVVDSVHNETVVYYFKRQDRRFLM